MISNKDQATWVGTTKVQGELTISESTTSSVKCVEDITGITTLYVLNTENTNGYLGVSGTVSGSVGTQVFTYDSAITSSATDASDESEWVQSQYVGKYTPKEIVLEAETTSTELVTFTEVAEGDEVLLVNSDDSFDEVALGSVSESGDADGANNGSTTDVVPTMTSNTAPSVEIEVDSILGAENEGYYACADDGVTSEWVNAVEKLGYFQCKFTDVICINKLTIQAPDASADRSIKEFSLLASNNGVDYENLGTHSDIAAWSTSEIRTFTFINGANFLYYKIDITDNHNNALYVGFAELELIENANPLKYTATIAQSEAPTKAFFDDEVTTSIALEDTAGRCVTGINENIVIDDTTASDGSNIVSNNELIDGGRIVVDGVDEIGGGVSEVDPNNEIGNIGSLLTKNTATTATHTGADGVANGNLYGSSAITKGNIYWEYLLNSGNGINYHGISTDNTYQSDYLSAVDSGWTYDYTGEKRHSGTGEDYSDTTASLGTVVGVRYCYETGELEFYDNGVSQGIAYTLPIGTEVYPALCMYATDTNMEIFIFPETLTYQPENTIAYSGSIYTQLLPNHNLTTKPTNAYHKGGEELVKVSSTTTQYVGTNSRTGMLKIGDTVETDLGEVALTGVSESEIGDADGANNTSTTDAASGGSATASGSYSGTPPSDAFANDGGDGNIDTWIVKNDNVFPVWLQYEMLDVLIINKYSIILTGTDSLDRLPKGWIIQASVTGEFGGEEEVVDTVSEYTDWGVATHYFTYINNKPFKYYRMVITENNGDTGFTSIPEMEYIKNDNPIITQYTLDFAEQVSAPISAKVLDRSVQLTDESVTYSIGEFTATKLPLEVSGRAIVLKVEAEKTGTTIDVTGSVINMKKGA